MGYSELYDFISKVVWGFINRRYSGLSRFYKGEMYEYLYSEALRYAVKFLDMEGVEFDIGDEYLLNRLASYILKAIDVFSRAFYRDYVLDFSFMDRLYLRNYRKLLGVISEDSVRDLLGRLYRISGDGKYYKLDTNELRYISNSEEWGSDLERLKGYFKRLGLVKRSNYRYSGVDIDSYEGSVGSGDIYGRVDDIESLRQVLYSVGLSDSDIELFYLISKYYDGDFDRAVRGAFMELGSVVDMGRVDRIVSKLKSGSDLLVSVL